MSATAEVRPGAPRAPGLDVSELGDDELLLAIRLGNASAFGELYGRHVDAARRLAAGIVPADDIDDVTSEAFTKMLRAIHAGRGPSDHPIRYLMVAVRTTAYNVLRSRRQSIRLADELALQSDGEVAPPNPSDETLVEAIQSLPERWRRVVWWCEIEGHSASELGELLDLSPGAASALSYRARRALRDAYATRAGDPSET